MQETTTGAGMKTYVLIRSEGARYLLDVGRVHGVVHPDHVTRVPGAPERIRGVINVEGRVLPLSDLAVALGGAPTATGPRSTAVLLAADEEEAPGLALLGEVLDVVELDDAHLEPPPAFGLGGAAPLVTGVAHLASEGLALVLDAERLVGSMSHESP